MNAEQLNSARLARWSQNGEARLTLEAASEWIGDIGFCPYLPVDPTGSAPAPSFLEAVVGRPAAAPSAGERARALTLLTRLIENSAAVPLKLGLSLGEQPDFVCSPDGLRYVYALRGDRNFKTGPLTVGNERVTPLSLHCWQAIEQQGPLDVAALQPILGRDITEAAIARALQELWAGLYIFPVYGASDLGAPGIAAQWELLVRRFSKPVAAGASTGHAEAQSAMISLYLQAAVAVREEELLAFLSPLAPQSKLREVIRGLGSMRQLDILDISGRAHVALQGGLLPEMVAQLSEEFLAAPTAGTRVEGEVEIAMGAEIESEAEIEVKSGNKMNSEIEIESVPQLALRTGRSQLSERSEEATHSTIKKFVPKKNVSRPAYSSRPAAGRSASPGAGEERGRRRRFREGPRSGGSEFSRRIGGRTPRPRNFGPSRLAASAEDHPRGGRPDRSEPREFGQNRNSGDARGAGSRRPFSRDGRERGPKSDAPKGYAAKGRGMGERAKRWEKAGEVLEATSSGGGTFSPRGSGFKSSGFQPGGGKFRGAKPFGPKSPGSKSGSKFGGSKPWQSKSSVSESEGGAHEERPRKPWKKFDGAGDSRGGARKSYVSEFSGFKARGGKPWAAKSTRSKNGESFPRSSRPSRRSEAGAGAKPRQASHPSGSDRTGSDQPGGRKPWGGRKLWGERKPWASKGAESRIGSAKSYAARSAAKPYGKTGGAKPWAKRSLDAGEEIGPKRREPKEGSETSPREKSGAKPFWAKNPRGGKGSSGAGRTLRPRGKKAARKSGKKK